MRERLCHVGWPPSPAHILNHKLGLLGIPYDSVRSKNALAGGLDDGEAATIAVAIEHFGEAVAVIDEKKASRIFLNRWSDRVTVDTVTLLAQADNRLSLDKNILADACFSALIHARMRVSREAIDWVIDLIGADRADRCPSLSAYAFTFPTHRE